MLYLLKKNSKKDERERISVTILHLSYLVRNYEIPCATANAAYINTKTNDKVTTFGYCLFERPVFKVEFPVFLHKTTLRDEAV